jgi:hypothetical protein
MAVVGHRIQAHFARLGGVELELPARAGLPRPPDFSELAR